MSAQCDHDWQGVAPGPERCIKCGTSRPYFADAPKTSNKDMAAKGRCKYSAKAWPRCKHGHEFTPENTYITYRGFRQCLECTRIRNRSPKYVEWHRQYQRKRRLRLRAQRPQSSEEAKHG